MKRRRISALLRCSAGTTMWEGLSSPSWMMRSARSVSMGEMPAASSAGLSRVSSEVMVFTLMTSVAPCCSDDADDDAVGFVGVARPVHVAAGARAGGFELLQVEIQMAQHVVLDGARGVAQFLPVGHFRHHLGALVADRVGGVAHVLAKLGVGQQFSGGAGKRRRLRPLFRPGRSCAAPPASVEARISARCRQRTPARWRLSAPPMCIRQELSTRRADLRLRVAGCSGFFGQHGGRNVGVLDGERAAEPAALIRLRQLDEAEAAHGAQQRTGRRRSGATRSEWQVVCSVTVCGKNAPVSATPSLSTSSSENSYTRGSKASTSRATEASALVRRHFREMFADHRHARCRRHADRSRRRETLRESARIMRRASSW